jgi:hypothetical protein
MPEKEDFKIIIACAAGFSLREHNIDSNSNSMAKDTIKIFRKLLDDSLRRESCFQAQFELRNAKMTFEVYFIEHSNKYPVTTKEVTIAKGTGLLPTKEFSIKGENLTQKSYRLSSTHKSCDTIFYADSKTTEIKQKVKKGSLTAPVYTSTDTLIFDNIRHLLIEDYKIGRVSK